MTFFKSKWERAYREYVARAFADQKEASPEIAKRSDDPYGFLESVHTFSAMLHMHRINPAVVEVHLPFDNWWELQCSLQRRFRDALVYDGRGALPARFQYAGITFVAKERK